MENPEVLITKVKELIGTNQTEKAIELLEVAKLPYFETELILLKADFYKVTEQQRIGLVSPSETDLDIRKINKKLIGICDSIERKSQSNPSLLQGGKGKLKKYLAPSLILGTPILIVLILIGTGVFKNPLIAAAESPTPIVTEPQGGDFEFGTPVEISYEIPDYSGNMIISFIGEDGQRNVITQQGFMPSNTSYSWAPPANLLGKSGHIAVETTDGKTGKSREIKLLKPVEEVAPIVDLSVEYFKGKVRWSKSPESTGQTKFRYAFTLDHEASFGNISSVDGPIAYLLTLHIKSKKTNKWELVDDSNGSLQKGESKIDQAEHELYLSEYGGRPLLSNDYIFRLCVNNNNDGNRGNNCVIDTFRTVAISY